MTTHRLSADWVITMDGAPIRGGAVVIDGTGRIVEVAEGGGADDLRPRDPAPLRHTVLLPGLINAHSHLELTGLGGKVTEDDFPAWIAHLTRLWRERQPAEYLDGRATGVKDSWAMGVTTVADCGATGSVLEALHELGGSGIAYHEVFGPAADQADAALEAWAVRLKENRQYETPRVRLGASPHAPYTVSGPLYRMAVAHARKEGLPIAVHVAESPLETEFVQQGTGTFADGLRSRGLTPEARGLSPVAWLDQQGVFGPDCVAIHCCTVSGDDIDILAGRGAAVAHCPRSNRRHHQIDAPLAQLLGAGLRVGVGTDSVASVSPLDPMSEARAARQLAGLDATEALALVTIGAARAIGLGAEVGSLAAGKWGDVVALTLPVCESPEELLEKVVASGPGEVLFTTLGGREVYRRTA